MGRVPGVSGSTPGEQAPSASAVTASSWSLGRAAAVDPATGKPITGFTENGWVGLSLLHGLFALEHNAICDDSRSTTAVGRRAPVPAGASR